MQDWIIGSLLPCLPDRITLLLHHRLSIQTLRLVLRGRHSRQRQQTQSPASTSSAASYQFLPETRGPCVLTCAIGNVTFSFMPSYRRQSGRNGEVDYQASTCGKSSSRSKLFGKRSVTKYYHLQTTLAFISTICQILHAKKSCKQSARPAEADYPWFQWQRRWEQVQIHLHGSLRGLCVPSSIWVWLRSPPFPLRITWQRRWWRQRCVKMLCKPLSVPNQHCARLHLPRKTCFPKTLRHRSNLHEQFERL